MREGETERSTGLHTHTHTHTRESVFTAVSSKERGREAKDHFPWASHPDSVSHLCHLFPLFSKSLLPSPNSQDGGTGELSVATTMTVRYPFPSDKDILLSYMQSLARDPDNDDSSALYFSTIDMQNVQSSCDCILSNLDNVLGLVLGGHRLDRSTETESRSRTPPGGLFIPPFGGPAIGSSLDDGRQESVLLMPHCSDILHSDREVLGAMKAGLLSSQETLRRVNAHHAYLLTSDIALLSHLWQASSTAGGSGDRSAALQMRAVHAEDAAERTQCLESEEVDSTSPTEADLVALDAEKRPSAAVKESYAKFIQATLLLLRWVSSALHVTDRVGEVPVAGTFPVAADHAEQVPLPSTAAPNPGQTSDRRTRTVRVRRYEIHDVKQIYNPLFDQLQCFFHPKYTQYDARIHQRLLHPSYFCAMRDLISEYSREIKHLESIAAREPPKHNSMLSPYGAYQHGTYHRTGAGSEDSVAQIVFRPPLNRFYFLRDSLLVYLSACINESDCTSLSFHLSLYEGCLTEARSMAYDLQRLPRPSWESAHLRPAAVVLPSTSSFEVVRVDHVADGIGEALTSWPPSAEEHGKLIAAFESYWDVREKVQYLRDSLGRDIRRKDWFHHTRDLEAAVVNERGALETQALDKRRRLQQAQQARKQTFWHSVVTALQTVTDVARCKAELNLNMLGAELTGDEDDKGYNLTTTSPFHDGKAILQQQVERLWKVVEIQGVQLEKNYPEFFVRGKKWSRRIDSVLKQAESMSVVFSKTPF